MSNFHDFSSVGAPQGEHQGKPHQHQVLINQSLLRRMEADVKELKEEIKSIKFMLEYIKEYTEQKAEREASKWF